MPRSRKRDDVDTDPSRGGAQATTKRQRVSLACDACRTAREKCDGGKPQCGPCASQQRQCSYTPTLKKRGVATGYLRTLESSLAWLFEYAPDSERALQAFLSEKRALDPRLHKKWARSRVHNEVTKLLSDGPPPAKDDSAGEESDQELGDPGSAQRMDTTPSDQIITSPQDRRTYLGRASGNPGLYQLPGNWRDLISIHHSHTHQWLPIVDQDELMRTAEAYPPHGLALDPEEPHCAEHAQLWAVFALASFQDSSDAMYRHPKSMFSIARALMPPETSTFRQPHVPALLLHGLVLLGQGSPLAACLVIGSACRIALQLHTSIRLDLGATAAEERQRSLGTRILAGCCVLDTWASLTLGQPAVLGTELNQVLEEARLTEGKSQHPDRSPYAGTLSNIDEPEAVLGQLNRFSALLDEGFRKRGGQRRITSEDLVKSLDKQFSYCNCLIHEESTPMKPAAFVLQLAFLTATVALATTCRPSLLSAVFEVAETCLTNFGAMGTPPLVVSLLRTVLTRADKVPETERQRWKDVIATAQSPWVHVQDKTDFAHTTQLSSRQPTTQTVGDHLSQTGPSPSQYSHAPELTAQPPQGQLPFDYPVSHREQIPLEGMVGISGGSGITNVNTSSLAKAPGFLYGNATAQGIDYDAIMEELGSIDCNDAVESNFLTNLGFAPDYDLGDMFHQGSFVG